MLTLVKSEKVEKSEKSEKTWSQQFKDDVFYYCRFEIQDRDYFDRLWRNVCTGLFRQPDVRTIGLTIISIHHALVREEERDVKNKNKNKSNIIRVFLSWVWDREDRKSRNSSTGR